MNADLKTIATKLKTARRFIGDSQMDVAISTGLSLGTVGNFEAGRVRKANRLTQRVIEQYIDDVLRRLDERQRIVRKNNPNIPESKIPSSENLKEILAQVA
jgi:transcriptional regulator with XRE-family HTH domain